MSNSTWIVSPSSGPDNYNNNANWSQNIPGSGDSGFFGFSKEPNLSIASYSSSLIGQWIFTTGASKYIITVGFLTTPGFLDFYGDGIIANDTSVDVNISFGVVTFHNFSNAGNAVFKVGDQLTFTDVSTASNAKITNRGIVEFMSDSTAGNSVIVSTNRVIFQDFANAGNAQLTATGGTVDFSQSAGPAGNHQLTVGSIDGAGTYLLGGDQLIVGSSGPPTNVSGLIDDAGLGGSLVKVGQDKLTLSHAGNTYSGGTTIERGAFEVAAIGAAGTGPISFESMGKAKATLEIDNASLSGHVFATNKIDNFGKHDILDLTGLHFHAGATAKYHPATDVLAVRSGHVADKLTLVSPHGTHFEAASDHHGGTDVFLFFA